MQLASSARRPRPPPARAGARSSSPARSRSRFLAGQVAAWQAVGPSLYFVQGSPAIAFFYVLTIVHGLHLVGGLYVLGRAAHALRRRRGARSTCARACRSARSTGISCCSSGSPCSACCCSSDEGALPMAHDAHAAALPPLQQVAGRFRRRQAGVLGALGQGDDVDLPALGHLHLHLLPDGLHERPDFHDGSAWPNPSQVFALHLFGQDIPLILIAIMTFVLITSSGTMALAVNYGYRRDRKQHRAAAVRDRRARRDLRRHAGLRVDQADHGRRAALGKSLGRAAVRLRVLHDHGLPRLPRDARASSTC